jgi:two-component system, OmpR family, response regulator MprA
VLDLMLPGLDGFTLCRKLRSQDVATPVLVLSARDQVRDRVRALDCGADDYLVKPFDVGELTARVRALLRRTSAELDGERLSFAELELDADRHGARMGDRVVELTRTEYQLLELLMLNPGRVLPHSLIYERVWGYDFGPSSNALRVYIGYLRRKLADLGAPDLIQNVRGVGYALRDAGS